jgi:competence ComEA-like helix-hairpin-helix protein
VSSAAPVVLFLHIPKTAGSTLSALVYENHSDPERRYFDDDDRFPGVWTFYDGFSIDEALAPPSEDKVESLRDPGLRAVVGHFAFGLDALVPGPSTYVTVLRDPVQRVLSLYAHEMLWFQDTHGILAGGLSLESVLAGGAARDFDNGQVRRLCGGDFAFGACSPQHLARAKENLATRFTLVGLTDRFDETVLILGRRLGWTSTLFVPKLVNRHRTAIVTPSEEALAEIAEVNRYDVELYRFAQELFDAEVERMGPGFARELEDARTAQAAYARDAVWTPVDLNRGSVAELESLPGVGPVLASRIADYRERSGGFADVRQLLEVPGLGQARYRTLVMMVAATGGEAA